MEDKKIKIWNRSNGIHHFVFSDPNRITPIAPGGFQKVPIEEIYHVNVNSRSFQRGILEVDSSEVELLEELGYVQRSVNAYSTKEFEKLLTGNLTKSAKDMLAQVTEHHAKLNLIEVARSIDLTQSKIEFIEKVTGMKIYDEMLKEDEEDKNK